jgi:hypothetical protein
MPTIYDFEDIRSTVNFLDLEALDSSTLEGNSDLWIFKYYFLTSDTELSATNGYDVITGSENPNNTELQNIEFGRFLETTTYQQNLFTYAFGLSQTATRSK